MNCFPCFGSKKEDGNTENIPVAQAKDVPSTNLPPKKHGESTAKDVDTENIAGKSFTFRELASATKNFRKECLLSEGGSGRVFKGTLQSGEIVAVKQLDKNSTQGNKDFLVELTMLSHLHHENLLKLIGYCADGDQRLLVYEYLSFGTVEDHLLDVKEDKKPLDWSTRIKIANGTAQGLEYLHEKANPPVIYRDLKSSNIMLDAESNPKLADYGLAKLGGTNSHVTPRVMGNYGYCAPEYERSAELTVKSDVYSFGVILLELLTGRRALDTNRPIDEQNLVAWAQPYFKDPKRFPEMADPLLGNAYPVKSLNQAVGVAAMCLQDEPEVRPYISDIVAALSFLVMAPPEPQPQPQPEPQSQPEPPVVDTPTPNVSDDNKPQEKEDNEEEEEEEEEDDEGSSQYESGDSYESSEYESEEEEEDQKVDGDEVASMSGTSNEDGSGSGKSSMSLKRKSTKKPKEDNEEWHESNGTSSARISSRKSSMRSKSKSKSKKIGSELENGSASKRRKSKHAKNRSYSTYQRDPSSGNGNVEPGNRRAKSVHYGNKNEKL